MSSVQPCTLPEDALLAHYQRRPGAYTDCYCIEIPAPVSQAQFVRAFYTTQVFKLERAILRWAVDRPSTDEQANLLAAGEAERFAAWSVEARAHDQLLLCDLHGRTRSWLMTVPMGAQGTRLYFGSAVVPAKDADTGTGIGTTYRLLLGFHTLYSRILLKAAATRLARGGR